MREKISIVSMASLSALGRNSEEVWEHYLNDEPTFVEQPFEKFSALVSSINRTNWRTIKKLQQEEHYKDLDPSVLLAIAVSRLAIEQAKWNDKEFGINIGSSRGATSLFEKYYDDFKMNNLGKVSALSSPTTTLGNISSWVGHDLLTKGPTISHSITCSTALHGVLNGIAWINSGMSRRFLVGGSEASNTGFTLAQMKALKIYTNSKSKYPCKSLDLKKTHNTMIIGEGASVFCLEKGVQEKALAIIEGVGYATEALQHNVSISTNADCFQTSMKMAMKEVNIKEVDIIVMHAPGTVKGDLSEYNAIKKVFGEQLPAITSNKWKIGHTLGASGGFSLEMAILMLQNQRFIGVPFLSNEKQPSRINKVMVNAVGFGGNAVSILLSLDLVKK
jgi:3-oxoacyl-(acyl-carrier-protein) synthase